MELDFKKPKKEEMITLSFKEYKKQLPNITKACKKYKITMSDFIRISIQRSLNSIKNE